MAQGFDIGTITGYIDETSFELISKAVLGTNLASYVDVRAGLKGNSVAIPIMEDDFTVANGNNCGWSTSDSASITQVDMCVYHAKVQHEYCPQALRDTFMAKALSAGQFGSSEGLPYEATFVNYFVEKAQNWNEKYLINGVGTCEGYLAQLSGSAVSNDTISGSWSASTAVAQAHLMYELLPPVVSMRDDLVLVVSMGDYKKLALGVTQGNYYHIAPDLKDLYVPGTNIRVVASAGITDQTNGKNNRILTPASNLILGTDLTGDFEQFKLWYSEDNDQVRSTMKWAIGAAVVEPGNAVLANPTVTN